MPSRPASAAIVAALLTLVVAAQPPARKRADPTPVDTAARKGGVHGHVDSAAVRRLCEAPDSVLAGRRTCVLRNQAAFRAF